MKYRCNPELFIMVVLLNNILLDVSFCRSVLMEQFSLAKVLTQIMFQIKIHFHWEVEENLQHRFGQMLTLQMQEMFGTERPHHKICLLKLTCKYSKPFHYKCHSQQPICLLLPGMELDILTVKWIR